MENIAHLLLEVTEALPEAIVYCDLDGSLQFVNESFREMVRARDEHILTTSFKEFLADEEEKRRVERFEKSLENNCAIYDTYLRQGNNGRVAVRIRSSLIRDSEKTPMGILRIITDIRETKKRDMMSEQQFNLIHVFTNLLQHDMRNDLQVILGYIESILLVSSDISPAALDMLEHAQSAALRMSGTIDAFNEADKFIEIDLIALLRRVAEEANSTHMELDITLETGGLIGPLMIIATPMLASAFHNIFRNAAEHAGPSVEVIVSIRRINGMVRVAIEDNGSGIPPEKISSLFTRPDNATRNGIGLYLTQHIIRACGGSIRVISDVERGAKFEIDLPLLH